jgi:ABC-type uncharacterized transport system auxiliary subunit
MDPRLPDGGLVAGGPTLQVLPFTTAAPFRSDRVTTRTGDGLWSFSHYHRWVSEPGELVSAAAARFLGRSDLFGAVAGAGSPFEPDYRLGGSVRALYWDRPGGRLVLEVEASLVAYPADFRAFWVRRAESPVQANDVAGLPAAAASALEQVLSELRADLLTALARTPTAASLER